MRTTVTLDPDTEQVIRRRMRERNQTFKQALNEIIRASTASTSGTEPFRTQTASMGASAVNLDRALKVGAAPETDELIRKMRHGERTWSAPTYFCTQSTKNPPHPLRQVEGSANP